MAQCVAVNSSGFLGVVNSTPENCKDFLLATASEYNKFIDFTVIDWDSALSNFVYGYGSVFVLGYFGTYLIGAGKAIIRRI